MVLQKARGVVCCCIKKKGAYNDSDTALKSNSKHSPPLYLEFVRTIVDLHRPAPVDVHQKYPAFLRSSIAASVTRSSARVSPRSVIRVAAISVTTSVSVAACERTPPVQLMSPTVR